MTNNPESPAVFFADKPLRMLFYCRFVAIGLGKINWETTRIMAEMAHKIKEVDKKLIFEEMSKLLMVKDPTEGLRLMESSGLMRELFPDIQVMIDFKPKGSKNVWLHTLQVIKKCPMDLTTRWAALWHDVGKPASYSEASSGEIHFYNHSDRGAIIWSRVMWDYLGRWDSDKFCRNVRTLILQHMTPALLAQDGIDHCTDSALRRFSARCEGLAEKVFDLSIADVTSTRTERVQQKREACLALKQRMLRIFEDDARQKTKLPKGLGTILMERFGLQGREVGRVMGLLHAKLIGGELTMDSDFVQEAEKILKGP